MPNPGLGPALGRRLRADLGFDPNACTCRRCVEERDERDPSSGFLLTSCMMTLCPTCGNKRCPHATDHRNACTDSNEPGQVGSAYGVLAEDGGATPPNS